MDNAKIKEAEKEIARILCTIEANENIRIVGIKYYDGREFGIPKQRSEVELRFNVK